jgi:hypothetical protein
MPLSEKLLATICSLSPNNFDLFVFAGLYSMRTSRIVSCNTLISPLRPWKVALDADCEGLLCSRLRLCQATCVAV